MKRIEGQGSAIRGLAFVDGQLWRATQDGRMESTRDHSPVCLHLDDCPVGLVYEQGQLWFWGKRQLIRIDPSGGILHRQDALPCHCLCLRAGLLWTACESEVCCYQLDSGGWKLLSRFSQLVGRCWSFDVSSDGSRFLRVWPAEGNRWQVGVYDSRNGQMLSQFKRGTLWLQAVFAPDDFTLMVSGWLPKQISAISFSGGACSQRHHLHSCGWSGPIYHFDERVVVVTQTGLQTYGKASFPPGQPEYSWADGYQATPCLVIPADTGGLTHRWHKRYSGYARCSVTAVASQAGQVALGHLDGRVEIHDVRQGSLGGQGIPVRAWGEDEGGLILLNPRDKTLLEISVTGASPMRTTPLSLDDYWPASASEWGQLHQQAGGRLILRDRYGMQAFDLKRGELLWKHQPAGWSPARRLLAWKNRLYLDQASRGLAWIDPDEGSQHESELATNDQQQYRLFALGEHFLLQTQRPTSNLWAVYDPERELRKPLDICSSWCEARVSACGGYATLTRHQVPAGQTGNVLLLDRAGRESGRWEIPWCSQVQAEPALQAIFAVSGEQLRVYAFEGPELLQCFRGHGGPIQWYQVDCSGGCVLSLDAFGWVRRWRLNQRPARGEVITDLGRIRQVRQQLEAQPGARILVSACLAGQNVRYDGEHCRLSSLNELVLAGKAIPICPEVLGGLSVPRAPSEIIDGDGADVLAGRSRVQTLDGQNLSSQFRQGAYQALRMGRERAAEGPILCAVMKSRSPSCGADEIYDGHFQGSLKPGPGVAAAHFLEAGIDVISSDLWGQANA